ncbi:hypothetical protein SBC1_14300 [Caballeronia sp. SBC1]|uniref:hypothetical protein n=1 Tax=Caballeronia sp. SBC2 TaxID=2705547 RepID=UPI0013E18291|nr:hypothetical protein [Caballeronia sp. SBC2]QIE23543.1 hypothetical protein SBC2_15690 [Caballeronia sp. SBC2]QIN61438.1 hypothetical protein SBC1_14300 [Caballeronia sp. SBC1]
MSGRTGLYFAWRMLDRYRNREAINEHQIEFALAAIANATGRAPIHGSPTYEFESEAALRGRHAPK